MGNLFTQVADEWRFRRDSKRFVREAKAAWNTLDASSQAEIKEQGGVLGQAYYIKNTGDKHGKIVFGFAHVIDKDIHSFSPSLCRFDVDEQDDGTLRPAANAVLTIHNGQSEDTEYTLSGIQNILAELSDNFSTGRPLDCAELCALFDPAVIKQTKDHTLTALRQPNHIRTVGGKLVEHNGFLPQTSGDYGLGEIAGECLRFVSALKSNISNKQLTHAPASSRSEQVHKERKQLPLPISQKKNVGPRKIIIGPNINETFLVNVYEATALIRPAYRNKSRNYTPTPY